MTTTKPTPTATTFTLQAPHAHNVFLAGSFNDWSHVTHPMDPADDGNWELVVALAPGRYEYKFIVDGQWCCTSDPDAAQAACAECCPNDFGTLNRVIEVK